MNNGAHRLYTVVCVWFHQSRRVIAIDAWIQFVSGYLIMVLSKLIYELNTYFTFVWEPFLHVIQNMYQFRPDVTCAWLREQCNDRVVVVDYVTLNSASIMTYCVCILRHFERWSYIILTERQIRKSMPTCGISLWARTIYPCRHRQMNSFI